MADREVEGLLKAASHEAKRDPFRPETGESDKNAAMRELAVLAIELKSWREAEARRAEMDRVIGQPAWIEERKKNQENQT